MAIIHETTMTPGKLELLAGWLPGQPWFRRTGGQPALAKVGGFRLDDPRGEVGIEFMVVTDGSADSATTYLLPLTYRGDALAGAAAALIGTAEHGVLGRRWIYDGVHDPVLVAQLVALLQGEAEPQAQNISGTPDPTVTAQPVAAGSLAVVEPAALASGLSGTELRVGISGADGAPGGRLVLRINRILQPDGTGQDPQGGQPCLSASWRLADGARARGVFATAQFTHAPAAL